MTANTRIINLAFKSRHICDITIGYLSIDANFNLNAERPVILVEAL